MPDADTNRILVTGSTRGIGDAIALVLEQRGAQVVRHGRADAADVIGADLAVLGAAEQLWDRSLERLGGRIDVLINNAGVFEPLNIDAADRDWRAGWSRTLQINLQAAANLSRQAVRRWRALGATGRIVNIASRAAYRGDSPQHWHYAASKAGMIAMTKTIARAYAAEGILAFAICPGFVMTAMVDDYLASRGGEQLLADIPLGRVAGAWETKPRTGRPTYSSNNLIMLSDEASYSLRSSDSSCWLKSRLPQSRLARRRSRRLPLRPSFLTSLTDESAMPWRIACDAN